MYSIYFRWIEEYSLENVLIVVLVNKRKRYIIMTVSYTHLTLPTT